MTFIANDCVGGRMYELLNIKYNVPFCWSDIPFNDFIYIMNNLNNINFNNICVKSVIDPKNYNTVSQIIVDGKIMLLYPHYIQNKKYNIPTKIDIDIFYKNANKYALEKYIARTNRMNLNDEIYFILHQKNNREGYNISDNDCKNFIKTTSKYHKILVTPNTSLLNIENDKNTNIILCNEDADTKSIASKIISTLNIVNI